MLEPRARFHVDQAGERHAVVQLRVGLAREDLDVVAAVTAQSEQLAQGAG
mgnify:CR=1 FL=1